MIKEKVLDCLYQLGFKPELIDDDFGYKFEYEDFTIACSPEDEASSVSFFMPAQFDVTEDNRIVALEAMAGLCSKIKYVQPSIMFDGVWLHYQHYFDNASEPTEDLIEHIVRALILAKDCFHKILNNEK